MGDRKNFSTGRQSRHFGCPFQAADDTNANRRSHNPLPLLHHKQNGPRYGNSPKNALRWQQCFFSHRTKLVGSNISFQFSYRINISFHTVTLLSAVAASLHYLPQMLAFNSHMRQSAYCRDLRERLLPCYCYAIKVNVKLSSPKFRNLPLQAM